MADTVKLGIAGLGTVGAGVIKILREQTGMIAQRCGRSIEVVAVSARDRNRERGISIDAFRWFDNAEDLAGDPEIDVFVELIGGSDGIALQSVRRALEAGKHVVTANKALIAIHGTELAQLAERQNVSLSFEASVAGGIPIIKAMRDGLVSNQVSRVYGILNGTCNYILSVMEESGRSFEDVLKDAQDLGYAEADPSFDVGGIDAAHKLAILSSLAFGSAVDFESIFIEGIEAIRAQDIAMAAELGMRIKLLGVATKTDHGIEQRVHPCLVRLDRPIASVDGVTNAVVVESDHLGRLVMEGPGAGEMPTASAVIADVADIAKGVRQPTFMKPAAELHPPQNADMDDHIGEYYLRLTAEDKPGVMAEITQDLAAEGVSIETIIQRGGDGQEAVPIILVTHQCRESVMKRALDRIVAHDAIVRPPRMIRIEDL